MIKKSTIEEILGIFFMHPTREFHIREFSRVSGFSMPTTVSAMNELARNKLITKISQRGLTLVKANREYAVFTRLKLVSNLERVYLSGIIDYLSRIYSHPQLIILFGSYARGEDIESSDVDIAIKSSRHIDADFSKYDKYHGRKIAIHEFDEKILSVEFLANLHNGKVLEGTW